MVAVPMLQAEMVEMVVADVGSCLHCTFLQGAPMALTTISSRQFNQDVSHAKRAAEAGPVVITDRGQPAFVLMRHDAYQRLAGNSPSILELIGQTDVEDFEFEPPRMADGWMRIPDLS